MYSVAPCDLPVSWSPSGWEPQSHCDFGRLRCHGSTCKEHYRCVISHSTITPCGKKINDVVCRAPPLNVRWTMTTFALLPLPEGGGALSWSYIARSPFWLKNVRFSFVRSCMLSCLLRQLEAAEAFLPFLTASERFCLQTVSSPLRHHASLSFTLWQVDILRRYLFDLWREQARDKALDHFFNTVFASDSDSS